MKIKIMLLLVLASVFNCNAMEQAKIADRDNPKKAFIRAVREGNYEKLVKEFDNKESIDDTHEHVVGFTGYSEKTHLTALQIAIDLLSNSGWAIHGWHYYKKKAEWEEALIKIIEFLLKNKANPNKATPTTGWQCRYSWHPLALAYRNYHYDIFRLLLDYGAKLELEVFEYIDDTVFDERGEYKYVLRLFQNKSELPTFGQEDYTKIPVNPR